MAPAAVSHRTCRLLILVLCSSLQAVKGTTGDSSCPCISTRLVPADLANSSCMLLLSSDGQAYCAPADYGHGRCEAWDKGTLPCNTSATMLRRPWCWQPWCYVDPDQCHDSKFLYERSEIYPSLYFSYDTCGSDGEKWHDFKSSSSIVGATLRVAVPQSTHPGHYRLDANGTIMTNVPDDKAFGIGDYLGYDAQFFRKLAEIGEYAMEYKFVSEGCMEKTSRSWWTACVCDVQHGLLDLCTSATWVTAGRSDMAHFTSGFASTSFYLLVPRPKLKNSIADKIQKLFSPITLPGWLFIFGTVIIMGCLVHLLGNSKTSGCLARTQNLTKMMHLSMMDFLSGGTSIDDSDTFAVKILRLGFGTFILLVITSYTANLTAFLVTSEFDQPIKSIEDCQALRCRLCVNGFLSKQAKELFGNDIRYVVMKGGGYWEQWNIDMLHAGECDAAIEDPIQYQLRGYDECGLMWTGRALFSVVNAAPVSQKYETGLNHAIRSLSLSMQSKTYTDLRESYMPSFECAGLNSGVDDKASETRQLGIDDFAGIAIVTLLFFIFAVAASALLKKMSSVVPNQSGTVYLEE